MARSKNAPAGIYIALGANQPYRGSTPAGSLAAALRWLRRSGVEVVSASRPWRTPAWPDPADPPFANAAAQIRTELEPQALMDLLHEAEAAFGRQRTLRNAPRTLDLDLIDYQGKRLSGGEGVQLPHPRATGRAFVLLPLRDIAPCWRDPGSGRSLDALIARLPLPDRLAAHPVGPPLCSAAERLKPYRA